MDSQIRTNVIVAIGATVLAVAASRCAAPASQPANPRHHESAVRVAETDSGFSAGWRGTWKHESIYDEEKFDYVRDQRAYLAYTNPDYWVDAHTRGHGSSPEAFAVYLNEFLSHRLQVDFVVITNVSRQQAGMLGAAAELANRNRTRMVLFSSISADTDMPDMDHFERSVTEYGFRGLALDTSSFIARNRHPRHFNTPQWNALYARAGDLGVPILWHVTHVMYGNERLWHGAEFSNEDILGEFEEVLRNNRQTNFIGAHMLFVGPERLGQLFDNHPNLYAETSLACMLHRGDWFTDEEEATLRNFYTRHQDRIVYGTGNVIGRWQSAPGRLWHDARKIDLAHQRYFIALELPREVLDKIAHGNLERLTGIAAERQLEE